MVGQIKQISAKLYCIKDSCNVYVVKEGDRCILIDFGTGAALQSLEKLGIKKVEAVLITHHHRDQAEGIALAAEAKIPILVPETEIELFREAEAMWQSREIYNNYNNRQDRFSILEAVDVEPLKDYISYEYLGMEFQIIPTPGHTTGSVSVGIFLDGQKIAFSGDLVYAPGKLWSLAATQWSYNGGEGIPYTILSLLDLKRRGIRRLFPSHGEGMEVENTVPETVASLAKLCELREQNPRLFELRETPYEKITEHVLFNRTSMANSYVLLSKTRKALLIDFGYDFMAGTAAGADRSSRRPWLVTIPVLEREFGVSRIDACIPTHYHDDHVAGINLLKRVYGTKVLCPESFADILEHPSAYDLPCLWYDSIVVDQRIKCGETIKWEEYDITVYSLSGHTKFAAAICFTADGQKFLCSGDQYAGENGTIPNYVYKNIFSAEDFVKSAALFRELNSDWILSGHWSFKNPDCSFYNELEQAGRQLQKLHEQILPQMESDKPLNDFPAVFYPYQKQIECSGEFNVTVVLLNEFAGDITLELLLADGFSCADNVVDLKHGENRVEFQLKAPKHIMRRAIIGCRIWENGQCMGTQAEMLVTVKSRL